MKKIIIVVIVLMLLGCGMGEKKFTSITVSILPQKYFAQKIVGERYDINVMIPPGASPAAYDPTPDQIKNLSKSGLYLAIGLLPFEQAWMEKLAATNPEMKIENTARGIKLIKPEEGHVHNHGGIDPHIWLSPMESIVLSKNMLDAIVKIDPDNREEYYKNFNNLVVELSKLNKKLTAQFADIENKSFLTYHPAWGYFAREYGLNQVTIEKDGKSPNPGEIKETIDHAREHRINVIVVQSQNDKDNALAIAEELGGSVLELDPLGQDYIANMQFIGNSIHDALSPKAQ